MNADYGACTLSSGVATKESRLVETRVITVTVQGDEQFTLQK